MRRGLLPVLLLAAAIGAPAQQPAPAPGVTARDWKHLSKTASTPADFRICAQWCRLQAKHFRTRQAEYEAELKQLDDRPGDRIGPKYPPSPDYLRTEIAYYHGLTQRWTKLAESYERKAGDR
jgi:hypothetical protein